MDLYIHSPIRRHGVVLNYLITGATLLYGATIRGRNYTSLSLQPLCRREAVNSELCYEVLRGAAARGY
jgi:hypothetical protein